MMSGEGKRHADTADISVFVNTSHHQFLESVQLGGAMHKDEEKERMFVLQVLFLPKSNPENDCHP